MRENEYQAHVIQRLGDRFPGCLVLKNDSGYIQGIPDLTVLYGPFWAMLEVKAYAGAPEQPNQAYYVEWANGQSFGAFIFPENEEEVLDALQFAFESGRAAFLSECEQGLLASLRRGEVGTVLVKSNGGQGRRR